MDNQRDKQIERFNEDYHNWLERNPHALVYTIETDVLQAVLERIERLQKQVEGYYENAKYTEAAFHEVTSLRAEVSQLREERESFKRELVALRTSLNQRETEAYKRWKTEGDLHQQGVAAGLDLAHDLVNESCVALGIGE